MCLFVVLTPLLTFLNKVKGGVRKIVETELELVNETNTSTSRYRYSNELRLNGNKKRKKKEQVVPERPTRGGSWTAVRTTLASSRPGRSPDCRRRQSDWTTERAACCGHSQNYHSHCSYSLQSIRLVIVEIKSQQHGCSIGSSTQNLPSKPPEARSPFADFSTGGCTL